MNMVAISFLLTIQLWNKSQSVPINNCDSITLISLMYLYSFMSYNGMNIKFILMNKSFIVSAARLPVVQFQKVLQFRNHLDKLFQARVVHHRVRKKGRTLIHN